MGSVSGDGGGGGSSSSVAQIPDACPARGWQGGKEGARQGNTETRAGVSSVAGLCSSFFGIGRLLFLLIAHSQGGICSL